MIVKPKEGCMLRDPVSRIPLPVEGKNVPNNSFWRRRLAAGDVTLVDVDHVAPPKPWPKPTAKSAKKDEDK